MIYERKRTVLVYIYLDVCVVCISCWMMFNLLGGALMLDTMMVTFCETKQVTDELVTVFILGGQLQRVNWI